MKFWVWGLVFWGGEFYSQVSKLFLKTSWLLNVDKSKWNKSAKIRVIRGKKLVETGVKIQPKINPF